MQQKDGGARAVAPVSRPNSAYRKHQHPTPAEVANLVERPRYGLRDATII
jgi:hypothetical protein